MSGSTVPFPESVEARGKLLARVIHRIRIDETTGCWNWTGSTNRGYGQVSSKRGKSMYKAPRVAYTLLVGPIPHGLIVRHRCDNPPCINPDHLEVGTQRENSMDAAARGRLNPKSRLNLRPGAKGYHGAGPRSVADILDERDGE